MKSTPIKLHRVQVVHGEVSLHLAKALVPVALCVSVSAPVLAHLAFVLGLI